MGFPKVVFGLCERCGGRGDYVASDGTRTAGTGYELKDYEGQKLCQICIIWLEDKKNSEVSLEHFKEEEKFRSGAGFTKT